MIGEVIKKIRSNKGYSQKEIAEKLGMSQGNYVKWEKGSIDPPLSKLQTLADILDVTVDEILNFGKKKTEGIVICFINQKGGTGKTTIAVALGTKYAADQNAKVCIIDTDFQQTVANKYEREKSEELDSIVDVFPLPEKYTKRFFTSFSALLDKCRKTYDLVLIDTMGSFKDAEIIGTIMSLSDIAIIPIEPTEFSLDSSLESIILAKEVAEEKEQLNKQMLTLRGIINKASNTIESKAAKDMKEIQGLQMFENVLKNLAVYHKQISLTVPIEHENFEPVYQEFKKLVLQ